MTKVKIDRNEVCQINNFIVVGHAGYNPGEDIVCSAISAITQTAILGLAKFDIDIDLEEDDGFLSCKIKETNQVSDHILETMVIGLEKIKKSYPDNLKID